MSPLFVFVILCFGVLTSDSCNTAPPVTSRSDARFVDSSLPSSSVSYSERNWNQQILNNVDISNYRNIRQHVLDRLSQHDVNPSVGVETDTGSISKLSCNSVAGLCNCILTLYTLGHPLHSGSLFYPDFNRETRETIQGSRPYSRYHYATEYALIDRAYSQRMSTVNAALYRGVNVPFGGRSGDTFQFNQFTSASESESTATQFLEPGGTLFEIHGAEGLSMSDVSQFTREQEYLIHPFEEFTVRSVTRENFSGGRIDRVVLVRQGYSFHDELLLV